MDKVQEVSAPRSPNFIALPIRSDWKQRKPLIQVIVGLLLGFLFVGLAMQSLKAASDAFDVLRPLATFGCILAVILAIGWVLRPLGRGFVLGLVLQVVLSTMIGLYNAVFASGSH